MASSDNVEKAPPSIGAQHELAVPVPAQAASHALIVGGSSGTGLASAIALAKSGVAGIVLVGRNQDRGAAAAQLVSEHGTACHFVAGDVTDRGDAQRVVDRAHELLGGIEILVSAAAPDGHLTPFEHMESEEIERLLVQIALPPIRMARLVLPVMKATGGTIVSIASDAAKVPTPGEAVTGGAMAAIAMFTRTLALEVKRYGVRVHTLTPSLIMGTRTTEALLAEPFSHKIFSKITQKASLGVPTADDLAETVAFLTSPGAARMTGQVISINGGISAG